MKSGVGFRVAVVMLSMAVLAEACLADPEADVLFAPPGATGVEYHTVNGGEQVHFGYSERFPADNLIKILNREFVSLGWTPREKSYLNPDLPTSHVRGWSQFQDATGDELMVVHQWLGEWQNSSGAVVTYVLRYSFPEHGDPDLQNLTGFGHFESREAIEEWELLRPELEAEAEAKAEMERRAQERENSRRANLIREESSKTGTLSLKVVKARRSVPVEGKEYSEWREEIEYDEEIGELKLEVVAVSAIGSRLEMVFSEDSAAVVREFSREHSGKMIAVFVGDELIWMPLLEGEISDIVVIEGNFNPGEAESLAKRIMMQ